MMKSGSVQKQCVTDTMDFYTSMIKFLLSKWHKKKLRTLYVRMK